MNNNIFALDIGTRSVTGIILEKQQDKFTVVDFCVQEHTERSMLDGQIHDVVAVADVIRDVKETLEVANGSLHKVCVAAAGRALKTKQAIATIQLGHQPITKQETIKHLELSAVQIAQSKLVTEEGLNEYTHYFCVGYSILNYMLDDEIIGSLIDQNGDEASVEIIATFLPKVVVESLLAALARADLEMEALTLEPIAAIQVLIPESMRRLNVALVDIGAGTSDIAITNKGTVSAYGMVPIAGDEITEAISDHYLLDFPAAEQTKRNVVTNGQDIVQDILGFETTITYEALVNEIMAQVDKLSSSLASEIIRLNKTSPKAVMLVGGGSLTPGITKTLAHKLQLTENRVAVRGIDAIQNLTKNERLPPGPDFVTPIGIAIAAQQNPLHYIGVKVNGINIRMFEMKQLTIGDGLVQAGIEINKLYGLPGLAAMIAIDDQDITLPGGYGKSPTIYLNNELKNVDCEIFNGDEIIIEQGANGKEPVVTINDVLGEIPAITIHYNNQQHKLMPIYCVNKQIQTESYIIKDKDVIIIEQPQTIYDFLQSIGMDDLKKTKPFPIFVNNQEMYLDKGESRVFANQQLVSVDYVLKNADHLEVVTVPNPTVRDLLKQCEKNYWKTIEVQFNGKLVKMKQQQFIVSRDELEITKAATLKPYEYLEINKKKTKPFIFQDIFRYVDIDLTNVNGHFHIHKNGESTTFYENIMHGDQLTIEWE